MTQPIPKNLREQMLEKVECASEEALVLVHEALLFAEKERLWREIQADAQKECEAGTWDNLDEVIRKYRDSRRGR